MTHKAALLLTALVAGFALLHRRRSLMTTPLIDVTMDTYDAIQDDVYVITLSRSYPSHL